MAICHGGFTHGRFHRDFNLLRLLLIYVTTLGSSNYLRRSKFMTVLAGELAGFIGFNDNSLVLHAVAEKYPW